MEDKDCLACERLMWDVLEENINGLVDKVTACNIRNISTQLISEDLIRGRGLFCRAVLKSLMASPNSAPVLAALVSVINTNFPDVGYLLLKRMIFQIRSSYNGSATDKLQLLPVLKLLAHLVNQRVVYKSLALELLMFLLLVDLSEDSVPFVAVFLLECGQALQDIAPQGLDSVFQCLDAILEEGKIDGVCQSLIRGLFAIRKNEFSGCPGIPPVLEDVVRLDDQVIHEISIGDEIDPEMSLDVFNPDM